MHILNTLVGGADPGGLVIYVAAMAIFLGGIVLARFRDDTLSARKARRWQNRPQ
jgi:hypothetical protein